MSDRSEYVLVRDKKTGLERQVTRKAYEILRKRYELLSDAPELLTAPIQKKRSEAVAVAESEQAQVEEKERVEVGATEGPVVVRRKPGPKPKSNA